MAKKPTPLPPTDAEPLVGDRLDNPYMPGAAFEPAPPVSAATIIKLWAGGEHAKAMAMFKANEFGDGTVDQIQAACPGWNELLSQ